MSNVRLILALHNHQPVGNFEQVFETAYRDSYRPFLEVLERYPDIPFALHTSGPLLDWLVDQHPDYVARVRALCESGQVEILGGGYYEPILTMIPHRDRVGQIHSYREALRERFGATVRGMWIAERVWEQNLVGSIVEAGIEYTVLDDFHFQRAGVSGDDLFGYYLTEDEGRLLKVFPGSEVLRYTIPFQEPHATYEYLRRLAERRPGAIAVFADDGEKFGSWPETYDHVYTRGWLTRFCDMIRGNRDWLEPCTFSVAVDTAVPRGKVYLPDCSYREMTEWVLPPADYQAYKSVLRDMDTAESPTASAHRPFVRAGGFWRNFKAKYPESDEMYCRMLGISKRLAAVESRPDADPDYLDIARQELYRSQCNCPYWHGAFGGLYLPHLRNSIYQALIRAHEALDEAEGHGGPRVAVETGDFNLDGRQEVRLENEQLIAWIRPAQGGHLYELDARSQGVNLLATLDRRPEPYHEAIREHARRNEPDSGQAGDAEATSERFVLKQSGLDRLLVYDDSPRKALVDHFLPADLNLDTLQAGIPYERGDFVSGTYLARIARDGRRAALIMERPGLADGHEIRIRKTIETAAGSPELAIHYQIDELPPDVGLRFGVEINLAGMAGQAHDRYFLDRQNARLGRLDARLDLADVLGLGVVDEWLDVRIDLDWSRPAGLWCFPIHTVSQSEGGYEGVYQSSAILPHWNVVGDHAGRWDVTIRWSIRRQSQPAPARAPHSTSDRLERLANI
jgi:alpha-amylase